MKYKPIGRHFVDIFVRENNLCYVIMLLFIPIYFDSKQDIKKNLPIQINLNKMPL